MSSPLIEVSGVSKKFTVYRQHKTLFRLSQSWIKGVPITRELWALKDVSFSISPGEKVGLVGRNGAGKTTLLRILAGIYRPGSGSVRTPEDIQALFNYGLGFNPHLSVADNIYVLGAYQGLTVDEIREKMQVILEFSSLQDLLYLPAKDLSSGQKERLLFSVFVQTRSRCLLLDESITLADLGFQKKSEDWLRQAAESSRTILMTSHNLDLLRRHCPRILWLEKGSLIADGASDGILEEYARHCLLAENPAGPKI